MQTSHSAPLYRLIVEIRGAFNELKSYSDAMNTNLEVTAAMRAVLESLHRNGPATIPDIARKKSVTRQHIQILADTLVERGLAAYAQNPAHQRSKLLTETAEGRARFQMIEDREAAILEDLDATIGEEEAEAAALVLQRLRAEIRRLGANRTG